MNVIRKSYNIFSEGGEPLFNLSLPSFERNDITNQKQRGIVPEVRYANGGQLNSKYLKGNTYDLSLAEIHELRKQGYKISYL